ncbi:putative RNA-binding protein [Trypanosoma rangeli]|uniref:Putative RNA-binding protein n=1 Tax=Trypanosoma rangeli TaxID=5698 RepID=A0A3R7MU85_TRYRA|nr:putative RNA-binding protein [Trypanosoma rangeli]RNF11331.1 putative RNA-binding protein [Trypanosoma rangeli]|eukprot:RNF11331.1 putative RNA-binding protein [Trypanosoma rangeli]
MVLWMAECAIATLHGRHCASKDFPLMVLYHCGSSSVAIYGRSEGREYAEAFAEDRNPSPVPLEDLEENLERADVPLLPLETEMFEVSNWSSHSGVSQDGMKTL